LLGSFSICRVFGITIRIHWMWLALILAFALLSEPQNAFGAVLTLLVLLVIVVLHELGHSLVARHYKIQVLDITLWPLGGMARMSEIPENSKIEGLIAIAGPMVNFALAGIALPVLIVSGLLNWNDVAPQFSSSVASLSFNFFAMNVLMGVFNLLPAFPMDGGRVLRAVLALFSDWLTATRRAVTVGKIFAVLMVVLGVVFQSPATLLLPLVGVFVWVTGSQELWSVRLRHGDIPGLGPRTASFRAEVPKRPDPPSDPSGARRPSDNPLPGAKGPLGDDEVSKLESFRGRIRPPSEPGE
jgi:Zn-dependent protease